MQCTHYLDSDSNQEDVENLTTCVLPLRITYHQSGQIGALLRVLRAIYSTFFLYHPFLQVTLLRTTIVIVIFAEKRANRAF